MTTVREPEKRSVGGVPLLYGFLTDYPGSLVVYCRYCLTWHHHRLTSPPGTVDYYEAHCYARPDWYSRGYWVEVTDTPWRRVRDRVRRASPAQARLLAAGKVTEAIRRKQLCPEFRPLGPLPSEPPPAPPGAPRKTRKPAGPRWPESYPQVPEEEQS
ncbi:hypothetical protein [Streptomyces mirabilis]|uniref:hypothetical protein n=1 Tax=Streptomyces mirabilis TaxID=68239 RepID=UPI00365C8530